MLSINDLVCSEGTLNIADITNVLATKGMLFYDTFRSTDQVNLIVEFLKNMHQLKDAPFRDNIDAFSMFLSTYGVIVTDNVKGCYKYLYMIDIDNVEKLLKLLGISI